MSEILGTMIVGFVVQIGVFLVAWGALRERVKNLAEAHAQLRAEVKEISDAVFVPRAGGTIITRALVSSAGD